MQMILLPFEGKDKVRASNTDSYFIDSSFIDINPCLVRQQEEPTTKSNHFFLLPFPLFLFPLPLPLPPGASGTLTVPCTTSSL